LFRNKVNFFCKIDLFQLSLTETNIIIQTEAGATFDNSFFDNSFVLVRQLKNRLFLGSVFVPVTGRLILSSTFNFFRLG
jgi:hypothetical protein